MRILKIILLVSIFLMAFLIHSVQSYTHSESVHVLIANRLYTVWSVELEEIGDWLQVAEQLPSNTRLFLEYKEQSQIRTFIQNGNWVPPMISGEFFTNNGTGTNQAVVGSRHYNSGNMFIEIYGVKYEIIGILGSGFVSSIDNMILINGIPEHFEIVNVVVDARTPRDLRYLDNFEFYSRHDAMTPQTILNNELLSNSVKQSTLALLFILSILMAHVYLKLTKTKSDVYRMVGISSLKIFIKNTSEYIVIILMAYFPILMLELISETQLLMSDLYLYGLLFLSLVSCYWFLYFFQRFLRVAGGMRDD